MKVLTIFVLFALVAQAASITITAQQLSNEDLKAMFGPGLKKQYGIAKVTVCSDGTDATSLPVALIEQRAEELPQLKDFTILPNTLAFQIIAQAQGNTKQAKWIRGGIAAVQIAAIAAGWSGLNSSYKTGLTSAAIGGGQVIGVLTAATTSASLVSYAQATFQSDPLSIPASGCVGPVMVMAEHNPNAIRIKDSIQIPVQEVK